MKWHEGSQTLPYHVEYYWFGRENCEKEHWRWCCENKHSVREKCTAAIIDIMCSETNLLYFIFFLSDLGLYFCATSPIYVCAYVYICISL